MLIRRLQIEGLSGVDGALDDLDRVVRVGGAPRARRALVDALQMAWACLGAEPAQRLGARLGLGEIAVEGEPLPDELHLEHPEPVRGLLGPERHVRLDLRVELDPPQFGELREQVLRNPVLVDALGAGPQLSLRLGLLFTQDWSVAATGRLSVKMGQVDLGPEDGSTWLPKLLQAMDWRLGIRSPGQVDVEAVAAAERSPDPARRAGLEAMNRALSAPPFSLGPVRVVEVTGRRWLALGPELLPVEQLGAAAVEAVGLTQAVFLDPCEILVLEEPVALVERPRAVRNWLYAQAEGDASPLEQIWLVERGDGDVRVGVPSAAPARPTRTLVR